MVAIQSTQIGHRPHTIASIESRGAEMNAGTSSTQTPLRHPRQNVINTTNLPTQSVHVEDSDEEDEEVATLTGTDRNKASAQNMLNTPAFTALKGLAPPGGGYIDHQNHLISASLDMNNHRRTPGAPLMRNSAFITPHKIFPAAGDVSSTIKSDKKQNLGRAQNHIQGKGKKESATTMGFSIVCSRPPPLPSATKVRNGSGPKGKVHIVSGVSDYRGIYDGEVGIAGRKAVYTPTDVALARNSDIFLRRTGTGAYSPYTEQLISGIDGVLKDDDTSTPQSVTSFGSHQDTSQASHKTMTSGEDSVLSRNEPWYNDFTEESEQLPKINRKASDVSSINSCGSVASGSEGLLHFDIAPQVGSYFQPKGPKNMSPNRLKQQQNSGSNIDTMIVIGASNQSGNTSSALDFNPHIAQHQAYNQNPIPSKSVVRHTNIQDNEEVEVLVDQNPYAQHQKQGSFEASSLQTNYHYQDHHRASDNSQMNYHQISGHISPHMFDHISPLNVNVPLVLSPQTIPPYDYRMAPVASSYSSGSPVPFDQMVWPHMHRNQSQNWGNTGDTIGWNHHQHQPAQQLHPMQSHVYMSNRHHIPHASNLYTHMNWEHQKYDHFHSGTTAPNIDTALFNHRPVGTEQPLKPDPGKSQMKHAVSRETRIHGLDKFRKFQRDTFQEGEHKITKQQSQKVLSDSSMMRMNRNNQDDVHAGCFLSRGKRGNRKSCIEEHEDSKQLTPEEEEAEMRRSELVESPNIRNLFKEFYRKFRCKEKESLQVAAEFAKSCLSDPEFPKSVHWRIFLEMADLKKRSNLFDEARDLYRDVCRLQPYASQGWLERSKLEEESGRLSVCSTILHEGLQYCPINESLRTRAIKHEERLAYEQGNRDLSRARYLLAPLQYFSIEKVWRTVLEGALMEARAGNEIIARQILKYLMKWVSWYGPLYLEAFRLERDYGHVQKALRVVDNGLREIPRYGPLWFGAFRICEGIDIENGDLLLPRTFDYIKRAIKSISRELIWKVQMEAAQARERSAHKASREGTPISLNRMLDESRIRFVKTILSCPENLCWKVWLAAGRMELSSGRFKEARQLFLKSYSVVPAKGRPSVLLECVRLEEFVGNTELAKAILCKTRTEAKADWKVWLQSVSMEVRSGNRKLAIKLAHKGLKEHSGTGRLWATLVQLREEDGEEEQVKALRKALHAVPKSGEVWCEAARIYLNPFSPCFNLSKSSRYLDFATKFTPQYGDSFLEKLRQEMISALIEYFSPLYIDPVLSVLQDSSDDKLFQGITFLIQKAANDLENDEFVAKGMEEVVKTLNISKLELRCSNADPNYGKLWFTSRSKPSDTARKVLEQAKEVIWNDFKRCFIIYISATIRQQVIKYCVGKKNELSVPSLSDLLQTHWRDLNLAKGLSKTDFVSGFIGANTEVDLQHLSLFDRRKILFGSDLLLTWKPLN